MQVTIEVRDGWMAEYRAAIDIDGSNDDEHDLLVEIADEIARQRVLVVGEPFGSRERALDECQDELS